MDIGDKIVRAWGTVLEMISDRGGAETKSEYGEEDIRQMARDRCTFAMAPSAEYLVVFHTSQTTAKKSDLFQDAPDRKGLKIIAVFANKPQGTTIRAISGEAKTRGFEIEFFSLRELQFNVSRHMLVPKHEVIGPSELKEVMKRHFLKSKMQLPGILETDPMSKYLAIKHGDVVKITRPSPNNGTSVFYRCCKSG